MKFYKKYKAVLWGIILFAVCAITWNVWMNANKQTPVSNEYEWNSSLEPEYVEYDGKKYKSNSKVETILIGGIDNNGKINLSGGNGTGGEADVLFLLVVNNETKVVDKIQINRDTITDIVVLDDNYNEDGITKAQIALSHAYGNGGSISCKNTVKAVENLFYDIKIDKYMFVNMGVIPVLNDFFGGVEVFIEDDFSNVDSSLAYGTIVNLKGKQATNFLRARKGVGDSDNESRMKRHRQYIDSLLKKVTASIDNEETLATDLYNQIYDYTATTLSASEMAAVAVKTLDYTTNEIIVPEGEFKTKKGFTEFHVDDAKLKEMVLNLFFVPVDSPTDND